MQWNAFICYWRLPGRVLAANDNKRGGEFRIAAFG
jgi:hypothetical protein